MILSIGRDSRKDLVKDLLRLDHLAYLEPSKRVEELTILP